VAVSEQWRDIKYKEIFDQETRGLVRRRAETCCKVEDLEGILNNLYIMDGADQGGRGSLQDTIMAATIAAYEQFISQWRLDSI
jgi:hypothetical protein